MPGREAAWREFFRVRTPELVRCVRHLLGAEGHNPETVEEVVARVWHALLRDDKRILRRYDAARHTGLGRHLAGVSRFVVRRYLRAEQPRRSYESVGGKRTRVEFTPAGLETGTLLNEFTMTLSAGEVQFLDDYLLSLPDGNGTGANHSAGNGAGPAKGKRDAGADGNGDGDELTPAAIWQRRHRLRRKLLRFLKEED